MSENDNKLLRFPDQTGVRGDISEPEPPPPLVAVDTGDRIPTQEMRFTITGYLLSCTRKEAVREIESKTNARFDENFTRRTHYVIANEGMETGTAIAAAECGLKRINEETMWRYIFQGYFPILRRDYPKTSSDDLKALGWDDVQMVFSSRFPKPKKYLMTYQDAQGETSEREILAEGWVHRPDHPDQRWLRGKDKTGIPKTFREDRVIELEELD